MKEIEIEDLKKIELHILDAISDFCERKGLTYFLCGGTLLGAARHKGFIPWDDDIDVMMPRPDYDRFLNEFSGYENLRIVSPETDECYPFAFATVGDVRTWKCEERLRSKYTTCLSVNVDVFPIDGLPDKEEDIKKLYEEIKLDGKVLQSATYKFGRGQSVMSTIMKNIGIAVFRISEILGINSLRNVLGKWDSRCKSFSYATSNKVGITAISHYGTKEVNNKDVFSATVNVEFEGKAYKAPIGYDKYLSQLYSKKYMELPPKEKQVTHHTSKCYWR